jgi:hypothetical protein
MSFKREFVFCCCSPFQDRESLQPTIGLGRSHAITALEYSNPCVTTKSIWGFPATGLSEVVVTWMLAYCPGSLA